MTDTLKPSQKKPAKPQVEISSGTKVGLMLPFYKSYKDLNADLSVTGLEELHPEALNGLFFLQKSLTVALKH